MIFFSWINVTVRTARDALWYLMAHPPPPSWKETDTSQKGQLQEASPSATQTQEKMDSTQPPPQPLIVEPPKPALFALIIGINEYADKNIKNLSGAVPDADDIALFLTETIGVPNDQITNLRNNQATRADICKAIEDLAKDGRIKKQDPILIYYAGHGAETVAPVGWPSADGTVQMLVPHDFVPSSTGDPNHGQGVLDVVLGHLLTNLAKEKGDNITVILDSCHSGSGTRDDENDSSFSTRGIELPKSYQLPEETIKEVVEGSRATVIAERFRHSGLRSHVLLSACMKGETAKERHNRGAFTSALLKQLREEGVEKLRYKDVVALLPDLLQQNPQCEGDNQARMIFDAKVASRGRELFSVAMTKPGVFMLEAGEARGVTLGAEFQIYADRNMREPLGLLTATKSAAFSTLLKLADGQAPFALSKKAFALQTRVGQGEDVKLLIELNQSFLEIFIRVKDEMQNRDAAKRSFALVDSRDDNPDLVVTLKDDCVNFEIMDATCREYGLTYIPFNPPADADILYPILRSSADFYWHLRRSVKQSTIGSKVDLECTALVESDDYTDELEPILIPEGNNLNVGGVVSVRADDGSMYGFKIKNSTALPLYAAVFFFDMSELSITPYYQPPSAKGGSVEPSIQPGGELTLGYGDSGTAPHSFALKPGQDVDVGYLKIFFSTQYVDWSNMSQECPFKTGDRGMTEVAPKKKLLWDTMTVAVVQRS